MLEWLHFILWGCVLRQRGIMSQNFANYARRFKDYARIFLPIMRIFLCYLLYVIDIILAV